MPSSPHLVAVLRIFDPHGNEQVALVDRPVLQIGSAGDECGLVLTGRDVAAAHCCLRWHGARWILHDRGAPAGTYINSRRVREPTALCPGDRISIVHHQIHFTTLPSLELPHVLARLRDRPIRWIPTSPEPTPPHTPPPPRRRRPPTLAAITALFAGLGLAAGVHTPEPPATPAAHLPAGTSVETTTLDPAAPAMILPPGTGDLDAVNDLSPETPDSQPVPTPDLSPETPDPHLSPGTPGTHHLSPETPDPHLSPGTPDPALPVFISEPPVFELPPDAVGLGRPTDGAILHALQLPPSPDYLLRCPAHAHGTSATIGALMAALAGMRNHGYHGELVVGDISRLDGGRYGPHKSHQSGRDVDIWLPIRHGRYARGCSRCGTDLCRPEPEDVDWRATWQLVQSLAERGAVEVIFLDWTLHPALAQAARDLGVPDAEVQRLLQHPVRGRPTLVQHSDGHIHHLHVRFHDPPPP